MINIKGEKQIIHFYLYYRGLDKNKSSGSKNINNYSPNRMNLSKDHPDIENYKGIEAKIKKGKIPKKSLD